MIPGISDVARLPRLGKIRLGAKKKNANGKEYPTALDHFNLKDVPWVEEVYGEKCKELDIMFPVENTEVFFPQALKAYRASGLFCRCDDGQTATRVFVEKDGQGKKHLADSNHSVKEGEMFELPCQYQDCPYTLNKMCKPIGRLQFLLPGVERFGCYEISTTSWNSMVSVNNYINAIKGSAGRISNIPLKLRLVPQKATANGKSTIIHVLELVYMGTTQSLIALGKQKALPAPLPAEALPAEDPDDVPDDLMPGGGEKLEKVLTETEAVTAGSVKQAFAAPVEEEEEMPPLEEPPEETFSGDPADQPTLAEQVAEKEAVEKVTKVLGGKKKRAWR